MAVATPPNYRLRTCHRILKASLGDGKNGAQGVYTDGIF
jgi:hypothetical protein